MYSKFTELLKKHETSPYKVAKETGIPTATLSDWKRGRSTPKLDKLQKIANYFNVPLTYFLEQGDENEFCKKLKESNGRKKHVAD